MVGTFTYSQKPVFLKFESVTINSNSGYVSITDITYGYPLGGSTEQYGRQYIGFTTMHGYQLNLYGLNINRSLIAGAGIGVLYYGAQPLVPLYLDFRYVWSFKKISPFIFEDNGILMNFDDLTGSSKMFINPGAGIKLKISGSLSANFGAGLFVQMGPNVNRNSFVNLKVGVVYKPGD
jgi:hypothetical protein